MIFLKLQEKSSPDFSGEDDFYYSSGVSFFSVATPTADTSTVGVSSLMVLRIWTDTIGSSRWVRRSNFLVSIVMSLTWRTFPIWSILVISSVKLSTISLGRHFTSRTRRFWWSSPPSTTAGDVPVSTIGIWIWTFAFISTLIKSIWRGFPVTGWRWSSCIRTEYDFFSTVSVKTWFFPTSRNNFVNSDIPTEILVEGTSLPYTTAGITPLRRDSFAVSLRIFASRECIDL